MIKPSFIMVFSILLLFYFALNYFIGLRVWQTLSGFLPGLNSKIYWPLFWMVAMSYLIGRLCRQFLPGDISHGLTLLGAYWLGAMYYLILLLVAVDLTRLLDRWLTFLPGGMHQTPGIPPVIGLFVLVAVLVIMLYGVWNARNPQVQRYELNIAKKAVNQQQLRIVMVSDIHLGSIVNNQRLTYLVDMVNQLKPDLVLLAGDMLDEDVEAFVEQKMADNFRRLKPKLGTFAVLGNHEYIGGHAEEVIRYLDEAGVTVLRDSYVKIANSFYVVGRDDRSRKSMGGNQRKNLSALMQGVDNSLPIILLDHQPMHLEEPQSQGVDLQLSGHTHRGQMFPNQFITSRMYEDDWGYLRKGNFQLIVSSGFGTWGPPIRVGNTPEIVELDIHFK
jgi:predicted MPP superfamily phosphohydrolase